MFMVMQRKGVAGSYLHVKSGTWLSRPSVISDRENFQVNKLAIHANVNLEH